MTMWWKKATCQTDICKTVRRFSRLLLQSRVMSERNNFFTWMIKMTKMMMMVMSLLLLLLLIRVMSERNNYFTWWGLWCLSKHWTFLKIKYWKKLVQKLAKKITCWKYWKYSEEILWKIGLVIPLHLFAARRELSSGKWCAHSSLEYFIFLLTFIFFMKSVHVLLLNILSLSSFYFYLFIL